MTRKEASALAMSVRQGKPRSYVEAARALADHVLSSSGEAYTPSALPEEGSAASAASCGLAREPVSEESRPEAPEAQASGADGVLHPGHERLGA